MNFVPFGFISILFVVIGIALGFFSPKKKIWWYGYRTPSLCGQMPAISLPINYQEEFC